MTPYAIEVEHVWFSYDKVPILKDVCLQLRKGDFLGILGPNGGGKTTLLKLLLGILKPNSGKIRILGKPPHTATRRVGYVAQDTHINLTFPISVGDLTLMGRLARSRMGRWYKDADRRKVEEVLHRVGMWEHRLMPVGELSGGQRQRVFIARALATEPEILFLDEPTASVDAEFGTNLYDLLEELNRTVTIVVITHDVGVISRHVKSVACINHTLIFHEEGKITEGMLDMAYQCPVDLVAHGLPHRVFRPHEEKR